MFKEETSNRSLALKNSDILKLKPHLKLKPNHYKDNIGPFRIWNNGTALSDGQGWYIKKED